MKFNTMIAVALLIVVLAIPAQSFAQQHHHYKLIDLGTFGGPQSCVNPGSGNELGNFAEVLNQAGAVAGWADTASADPFPNFCFNEDCFVSHTFVWKNGAQTDLGALPGGASSGSNWISANGLIAGLSENGEMDRLKFLQSRKTPPAAGMRGARVQLERRLDGSRRLGWRRQIVALEACERRPAVRDQHPRQARATLVRSAEEKARARQRLLDGRRRLSEAYAQLRNRPIWQATKDSPLPVGGPR
jgi:hypothetical protein